MARYHQLAHASHDIQALCYDCSSLSDVIDSDVIDCRVDMTTSLHVPPRRADSGISLSKTESTRSTLSSGHPSSRPSSESSTTSATDSSAAGPSGIAAGNAVKQSQSGAKGVMASAFPAASDVSVISGRRFLASSTNSARSPSLARPLRKVSSADSLTPLPPPSAFDRMWSSPYDIASPKSKQRSPSRRNSPRSSVTMHDPPTPVFMSHSSPQRVLTKNQALQTNSPIKSTHGTASALPSPRQGPSFTPQRTPPREPARPLKVNIVQTASPQGHGSGASPRRRKDSKINRAWTNSASTASPINDRPNIPTSPTTPKRKKAISFFWDVSTPEDLQVAWAGLRADERAVAAYQSSPEEDSMTGAAPTQPPSPSPAPGSRSGHAAVLLPTNQPAAQTEDTDQRLANISNGSYADGAPSDWDELDPATKQHAYAHYLNGAPLERRKSRIERLGDAFKRRSSTTARAPHDAQGPSSSNTREPYPSNKEPSVSQRKLKKRRRVSEPAALQARAPSSPPPLPNSPPESPTMARSKSQRSIFSIGRRKATYPSAPVSATSPVSPTEPRSRQAQAVPPVLVSQPPEEEGPASRSILPRSYSVPAMPTHFGTSAPSSLTHSYESHYSDEGGLLRSRRDSRRWSKELSTLIQLEDDLAFQQGILNMHEDPSLDAEPESSRQASVASFDAKACFVVRELLASEKSYLKHLLAVEASLGPNPPIPLSRMSSYQSESDLTFMGQPSASQDQLGHVEILRAYLPPIIALTDLLIQRWAEDPSPVSVALTFLQHESSLKQYYSSWVAQLPTLLHDVRNAYGSCLSPSPTFIYRSRRSSRGKPSSMSDTDEGLSLRSSLAVRPKSWGAPKRKHTLKSPRATSGKLTMQDIVIMPSQRITRYELFLKGLVKHTSGEPDVSALVQHALDTVQAIAAACDRHSSASFPRVAAN